ncbi:MAG: amidohydrolase [Acidobacteria bacterium]|nr:MAG: amidohydrolase [Acidobacteriota bacterium]
MKRQHHKRPRRVLARGDHLRGPRAGALRFIALNLLLFVLPFNAARTQTEVTLAPEVREFVSVDAPTVALTHARVIDGTGSAPKLDQTLIIARGQIQQLGPSASVQLPTDARVIDLQGKTVLPGLVLLHEHMFYPTGRLALFNEMGWSFPRLYLACGVTSLRTTGSVEPYTDLNIKRLIDTGKAPGPKLHVTGPYLDGGGTFATQFHVLTGPEDARRMVELWASEGATSFKAYMYITRAELAAAVAATHERKLKITGHLCAVGFREAAALGIDNLEHGIVVDTEFVPGKKPDVCPAQNDTVANLTKLDIESAPVQEMIRDLVARHVAVTSTLPVFEAFVPGRPPLQQRVLDAMTADARTQYLVARTRAAERKDSPWAVAFQKELQFERDFARAGGLLLAGTDPTGNGGVLAGFGSQREVELLVEAGFTPLEAIHIATANGAEFLGESASVGTIAAGKQADLIVVQGDPAANINDIEKVELVFKDGIGYNSAKLIESVRGSVGWR